MSKSIRILCLGDSLTEGYSNYGTSFNPYADAFKLRLQEELEGWEIDVVEEGKSGDLVTLGGGFKTRLLQRYAKSSTRDPLYDWVLILGGTNDLGFGRPAVSIHEGLTELSAIALEKGAKVLFMTVPECAVARASLDSRRNQLNDLIRKDEREDVFAFDLHAAIPYHKMEEKEREVIWDDGLHLTAKGYDRMGELIGNAFMKILGAEKA